MVNISLVVFRFRSIGNRCFGALNIHYLQPIKGDYINTKAIINRKRAEYLKIEAPIKK